MTLYGALTDGVFWWFLRATPQSSHDNSIDIWPNQGLEGMRLMEENGKPNELCFGYLLGMAQQWNALASTLASQ